MVTLDTSNASEWHLAEKDKKVTKYGDKLSEERGMFFFFSTFFKKVDTYELSIQ